MHNLIPHFIQQNFTRGVYRGQFAAVGMFLDVSGFSTMTEALMGYGPHGAEVLAAMMRAVFDPLAKSVYAQGGFIANIAGDSFTALFPLDQTAAEGYQRALAAAWGIHQRLSQNITQHTPYGSFEIQAKVGLAVGEVAWGIVTSQDHRRATYYFQGTAVDACAQAEHLAQAGETILEAGFHHQVEALVQAQPFQKHYRLTHVTGPLPQPQLYSPPPSDLNVMSRFFPAALFSQAYNGEFRQVVNLFISLPTVRTEAQLAIFMQTLFELQDHYGGLLNKLDFGDKGSNLLLFWGTPVAYENDIERTMNFIMSLQPLTSIPINAGVTYQIAYAGFIGSPLMEDYTCYGSGINLAARFMTSAPRGEIWVDEHTARRARTTFELDFEGELAFKGFADKQRVYVLRDRKEDSESIFPGKLVGRSQEIETLTRFVTPLWQGKYAGALVIMGEAGIGKSRLVHEFRASPVFAMHQALWALCQADAILREPLNPFRYWLRRYFGQSELTTEARNKRSFNLKLDDLLQVTQGIDAPLADELDRTRSFLGALVDLRWSDSLYEQLDPLGRYENTLIALNALLRAESLRQPVILFLEDTHWLDDDSLAYLPRLERTLTSDENKTYPIAILATARREGSENLLGLGLPYQEIDLGGILGDELRRLSEELLQGPPSPELQRLLEDRTEGNPFFAEQVLRYLQEESLLEHDPGGWRVTGDDQAPLPIDVRAVLVARLDRLGQEVKDVVQTASILGREFEVQLLVRMLQNDERLLPKMTVALQAAIWIALNELRYLFKHALVHDAAYQTLVRSHRQSLHALAVEALEGLYAADLSLRYGELAYHSQQAGMVEKARAYLRQAGDTARDAYQNSQAVDYYSRALNLAPEDDLETRYNLLLSREALYNLLGNQDARRQDLEALARLAGVLDAATREDKRQAEVEELKASFAIHSGDYAGAAATAKKAVDLARTSSALDVAIRSYLTWSFALWRLGKYNTAIRRAKEGLNLARHIDDRSQQSRALNILGLIAFEQKIPKTVHLYLEESLRIAQETGNRRVEIASLNNLGNLAAALGDFTRAQESYERALRLAREIGDRIYEGRLLGNLGWTAGNLGDYVTGRTYCEQELRLAREVGDRRNESYNLINLSSLSGQQGDSRAAIAYAKQGLVLARQTHDPSCEAWALTYAGHAHLALGQVGASLKAYQDALDIRRSLGQPNLATEPLAGLGRAALAAGDISTAQAHIQAILTHLDRAGTLDGTDEPMRVYLTCYQVLLAAGDPQAGKVLETAYNLLQERSAKISDVEMRRNFLENVPYHRQILEAMNFGSTGGRASN